MRPHCHERYAQECQGDKADNAGSPPKSKTWLKPSEGDWVDYPSNTATSNRNASRNSSFRCKVCRHYRDTGNEEAAGAQAHADPLCQYSLPVRRTYTSHHDAEDGEEATDDEQGVQVATVEQWPGQDADDEQKARLKGPDP